MTTEEISMRAGCATVTARKWAKDNDVSYVGSDRAKIYIWTEEDFQRFLLRAKPGKRAKKKQVE